MSSSGLYRSSRQQMIAGVMGGIAERFGWNANLLRVLFCCCFSYECSISWYFGLSDFMDHHS